MPFFDAPDGTRLAHHLDGDGAPLVCLPGGPMQASVYYRNPGGLSAPAVRSALATLPAPVLLIAGECDPGLPPGRAAEYAALLSPGRLVVQPGAGHFPWLDDPDRFVRVIEDFLNEDPLNG